MSLIEDYANIFATLNAASEFSNKIASILNRGKILSGDCLEVLRDMDANSVDALVTDPPAGIGFMGKDWDKDKGGRDSWVAWMTEVMRESLRVLKPGAHGLVWALPRTSHWTATALENAGFEIRDVVTHLFGTGFPKSLDVSKAILKEHQCQSVDPAKIAGEVLAPFQVAFSGEKTGFARVHVAIRPEGEQAKLTVIGAEGASPALMAMLPLESTTTISLSIASSLKDRLAADLQAPTKFITATELKTITGLKIWNLLQRLSTLDSMPWSGQGTALKPAHEMWVLIRKPCSEKTVAANVLKWGTGAINVDGCRIGTGDDRSSGGLAKVDSMFQAGEQAQRPIGGRFPANLVLDEEAASMLDEQSGTLKSGARKKDYGGNGAIKAGHAGKKIQSSRCESSEGGASRFFYVAKASKSDRGTDNKHPTVKSTKLMSYLCRLVTPPGGLILDPFAGSGSTGVAAKAEGFRFLGIEKEAEYVDIALRRVLS